MGGCDRCLRGSAGERDQVEGAGSAAGIMKDYRAIFEGVEATLIREGSRNLPESKIRANLDEYRRIEGKISRT